MAKSTKKTTSKPKTAGKSESPVKKLSTRAPKDSDVLISMDDLEAEFELIEQMFGGDVQCCMPIWLPDGEHAEVMVPMGGDPRKVVVLAIPDPYDKPVEFFGGPTAPPHFNRPGDWYLIPQYQDNAGIWRGFDLKEETDGGDPGMTIYTYSAVNFQNGPPAQGIQIQVILM